MVGRHFVDAERDDYHSAVELWDAATLIVVDRSLAEPKVLLGQRHSSHVFMPGKFVFPGGRVDLADESMPVASTLQESVVGMLLRESKVKTAKKAQALALAAIRETFEETGLVVGLPSGNISNVPVGPWSDFVRTNYLPNLSALQFIARAITPPGFPRRFDARFFCVDAEMIAHRMGGIVGADAELVKLAWLPIPMAMELDLPLITGLVLEELRARLDAGCTADLPVPFYCNRGGAFVRTLIVPHD